jgi:hypothetical protein
VGTVLSKSFGRRLPSDYMAGPLSMSLSAINSVTGEPEWEREFILPSDQRSEESEMLLPRGWQLPGGEVGALVSHFQIGYWSAEGEYLGTFISPDYAPRHRTLEESVRYWESLGRGPFAQTLDSARTVDERMTTTARAYQGYPVLGPGETVWLLINGDGETPGSEFEVFRGTEYLGRVPVPDFVHEFDIRGNMLVVLRDSGTLDELGFERKDVAFYDIAFPVGSSPQYANPRPR